MYILGISCFYHDASACLVKDGKVIAAAEEERFTRKKHDISFPVNAINFCLDYAKININQIDHITFYEKPLQKFERVLYQSIERFPFTLSMFYKAIPSWLNEKLRVKKLIRKKLKYKKDIFYIEHHLCHAASSYFISPFKESAILTIDGVGEWDTSTAGYAKENQIKITKRLVFPHSIGLLYSTVTAYLGFSVNNSEYKVMGLSPYGRMDKTTNPYYSKFKKIVNLKEDGSFELDMDYFDYHYKIRMPSKKFIKEFGPARKKESGLNQRHKDIAAALQLITEEITLKMLNQLYRETKCPNLCLAGGSALNSVANGKILGNTPFKDIYIQPAAGDGGTSMGAALYAYYALLNQNTKKREVLKTAYLGPEYSHAEIKKFLDENKIKYSEFKNEKEIIKEISKLIFNNNVIGWFQGRMEWGPRALGSRSILSNPANPKMQEILNLKVKHREKFRPFAPVICEDDAKKYFECDIPIPKPTDFMLMVYPIKKQYHKLIPAVTHVDGSGRLQTIRREDNELYYDLIKEFGKLSGIPILINTSFNIRGEPIVLSPYYAYRCMMGTGIDYLLMDKFLIKREDNPQDMWDSEKYAKD
ncbi:MAG: carbamoyltransferase [Candidatus Nanoarchaeia archaeon]|nr:carbamoyltransferase [Candidatus Nanoarchaeia archaeon]